VIPIEFAVGGERDMATKRTVKEEAGYRFAISGAVPRYRLDWNGLSYFSGSQWGLLGHAAGGRQWRHAHPC
jgi:hypothetical protein